MSVARLAHVRTARDRLYRSCGKQGRQIRGGNGWVSVGAEGFNILHRTPFTKPMPKGQQPATQPMERRWEASSWTCGRRTARAFTQTSMPTYLNNLRGRFQSGSDGTFEVQTIVPPPYEIPKGGPTGVVLNVLGRHFFRPARLHVKVRHPQYRELTSQLYFCGGTTSIVTSRIAVREDLVAQLKQFPAYFEYGGIPSRLGMRKVFAH